MHISVFGGIKQNMTGKDAGYVKTSRLAEIKREMAKAIKNGIEKQSMLDWVELNIGLSRTTACSYIDLIVRASGWVEIDGKIVFDLQTVPS